MENREISSGHFIKYFQADIFDEVVKSVNPNIGKLNILDRAYFQHCAYLIETYGKMTISQNKMSEIYGVTRVSIQRVEKKLTSYGLLSKGFDRVEASTFRVFRLSSEGTTIYRKIKSSVGARFTIIQIDGNVKSTLNEVLICGFIGFTKNATELSRMIGVSRRYVDLVITSLDSYYSEFRSKTLDDFANKANGKFR